MTPAFKPVAPPAAQQPQPAENGRVLHRVRGFMNCVERVRRENSMLASFLSEGKLFVDDEGRVICKLASEFARMMLDEQKGREILARAVGAELKRPVEPHMLVLEVPEAGADDQDTVLDDLIRAAEEDQP